MYKLIGTDFDGTLLDDNKNVSKEDIEYLKKAKDKGLVIVGVTGRPLESAKEATDIKIFDYLILNNGSNIYDVEKEKSIFDYEITKEEAKRITEYTDCFAHQFDYCTFNGYNLYKNFYDKHLSFIKEVKNLDEVKEPISKINIFLNKGIDLIEFKKLLMSEFPTLNVFIMQDSDNEKQWVVITPNRINKKEGLKKLGEILNIGLDEMIFFGDGLNDLEAIAAVGMGVAMDNALDIIKKKAKTYTKNNNHSGIAYFLRKNIN